ncbi:BI1-like protein [Arachis hypogaea]|uniref:BI1-like protein n=1 Tax=Arachis hypogaea TaxID=3818 RepID=UPI003B225546
MVLLIWLILHTPWISDHFMDFNFVYLTKLAAALQVVAVTMFFPFGPAAHAIYGGIGAMIFSGYIIYDTDNLIKCFTYDEYIGASVTLYLDILNLFLAILNMLREANN